MRTFEDSYQSKAFWALVVIALVIASLMVVPFIPAILWSTVLTILIYPLYSRWRKKMPASVAAGLATVATILIIGVPLAAVGLGLFVQVNGFVRDFVSAAPTGQAVDADYVIHEIEKSIGPTLRNLSPNFNLVEWFEENRDSIMQSVRAPLGKAAYSIGYTAFTLVIAFLTMFFMLRDGHRLERPALELLPLPEQRSKEIFARIAATVRAVFVGVVMVAAIQGTVAGITYYFCGVPNAVVWGVATIVLCTIPLLGSPIVYVPLALMLMAQGNTVNGVILLAVGFIIVSNIDNVLRPFIIGQQVELHPMAVFFSLLGGVLLFGPVGIMAGPMLLTILLALQDVVREMRRQDLPEAT